MKGLEELLQLGVLWPGETSRSEACTGSVTSCGAPYLLHPDGLKKNHRFGLQSLELKEEGSPDCLSDPNSSPRSAQALAASECGTPPPHATGDRGFLSEKNYFTQTVHEWNGALCRFGIEAIDYALPESGLRPGVLHEFTYCDPFLQNGSKRWTPPFLPLLPLLARLPSQRQILWIGKNSWPTAHFLARAARLRADPSWLRCHFFLDTPDRDSRLWGAIQALQTRGIAAIIIDGSRFPFLATRRLQLAASNSEAFLFLFRPPWEIQLPSAARTKWRTRPIPSAIESFRWSLELLRARGITHPLRWIIEWQKARYGEEHFVGFFSPILSRTSQETTSQETTTRGATG